VKGFLCRGRFSADVDTDEIVTVEVAVPEPGVMVSGENEQLKPVGIPLHESVIGLLNDPDCGVAATVKVPVWPAEIVTEAGVAVKDNVDGDDDPPVAAHEGL
jgi:hypothetical protein